MKPLGQIGLHLESMVTLFREESLKKHFVVCFVPQKSSLDNTETCHKYKINVTCSKRKDSAFILFDQKI